MVFTRRRPCRGGMNVKQSNAFCQHTRGHSEGGVAAIELDSAQLTQEKQQILVATGSGLGKTFLYLHQVCYVSALTKDK